MREDARNVWFGKNSKHGLRSQTSIKLQTVMSRSQTALESQLNAVLWMRFLRSWSKTAHLSCWNKSPRVVPWVLEIICLLGTQIRTVWCLVEHFPAIFLKNCSNRCCNTSTNIVMENDRTIEHLWICLSDFTPQNFAMEVYVHMLVHCATLWHHVLGNYTGIIVSHYHHLLHHWRLVSEFLWPYWIISFPNEI